MKLLSNKKGLDVLKFIIYLVQLVLTAKVVRGVASGFVEFEADCSKGELKQNPFKVVMF